MAFNRNQFEDLITTVLNDLGLHSPSAVNLLLGTAAQESGLGTYLRQINGPALGIFQMEPATESDIWGNFLRYHTDLRRVVVQNTLIYCPSPDALVWNLAYSIAMARIKYYRAPQPLPAPDDYRGLAEYWKLIYNTPKGKGTVKEFIENYRKYILQ